MRNLFINESVILPYGYFPTVWLPMEMEYRPAFLLPFVIQDMSYFRCFFMMRCQLLAKPKITGDILSALLHTYDKSESVPSLQRSCDIGF